MIDLIINFRGIVPQRQRLPAVPAVGSYLYGPGDGRRLWVVNAVALDSAVEVFCTEVSPRSAGELTAQWAAWDETIAPAVEVDTK